MRVPFWAIGVLLLLASVPVRRGRVPRLAARLLVLRDRSRERPPGLRRTMRQPMSRAEEQTSWAIPTTWIASFGAAFLLYGVLLVSYGFAWWAAQGVHPPGCPVVRGPWSPLVVWRSSPGSPSIST